MLRTGIDLTKMFGRVRIVEKDAHFRVREVRVGEDLKVRRMGIASSRPGQWEFVQHGEDFTIQLVGVGEHFTIRFVELNEGLAYQHVIHTEPPVEMPTTEAEAST